jgi:3-(3-hydroxy-phenyl)propionate hydroxylase
MFDQPDLETLLRTRMKAFASIEFRGNVEVDNLRADENGRPVVEFTDTVTGAREEVIADYVLGCDGANSTVRQAMGSAMTLLRFDPQRWLVVDIATDRELGHWDGVHQVCDARRAATYMRIGPDRHRWEIQLLDHENPDQYGDLTALAPLLRPWAADTSSFRLVRVTEYTFRAQIADRWRRGSVFILGDAAHLTPPFIGQGMGAGIRDAANLAWKIAGVLDGSLDAAVLDTYEQERKPHARAMIRLAMIVGRAMTGGGPLGDRLRRHVVPLLPLVPGLRRRVLDSATPALSASCLVHRSRHRRDLAGTLCPNTVLDDGMRLDEAAAGRFVLVAAGCPDVTSAQLIGIRPRRDSDLGRWLRRGRATAALVRPDGTVARAGTVAAVLGALWFPHLHQPAPIEQY